MRTDQPTDFERGQYISFATRKRSGEFVATPVWFAPHGGSYYLFSAGDAGKVKRLRNFSDATVAACTATGRVTGEPRQARAEILETEEEEAIALKALHRKYGLKMKITDCLSSLTGKKARRAYIRVELVS